MWFVKNTSKKIHFWVEFVCVISNHSLILSNDVKSVKVLLMHILIKHNMLAMKSAMWNWDTEVEMFLWPSEKFNVYQLVDIAWH